MKHLSITRSIILLATAITVLSLVACNNNHPYDYYVVQQELLVDTQSDSILFEDTISDPRTYYLLSATVDFPTDGPQPLTDSVCNFIREVIYYLFDDQDSSIPEAIHIPFNTVCSWNGDNIVTDFISNYSPLYQRSTLGVGADYLTLAFLAQTETFITYVVQRCSCGASCSYDDSYCTFRKIDGHLIDFPLRNNGFASFLKKYPKYTDLLQSADYGLDEGYAYAYLDVDGLTYRYRVFSEWPDYNPEEGWHEITIPYSEIKPYLTKEAQALIPETPQE